MQIQNQDCQPWVKAHLYGSLKDKKSIIYIKGDLQFMDKRYKQGSYVRGGYDKNASSSGTKVKLHASMIVVILLLTFGVCFALYMINANRAADTSTKGTLVVTDPVFSSGNPNESGAVTAAQTTTATTTEAITSAKTKNPVPESTPMTEEYWNSCAFIGDSLTEGLAGYGFIPKENVLAAQGMNIDKINTATIPTANGDMTILQALEKKPFQNVYIMLGSNGIAWLTNEKMVSEYSTFVDSVKKLLPDSSIYVLSIPPVSSVAESKATSPILNSSIDSYNSELLKMANEKELYFVDINTALKGNDGKLPVDYASSRDGMHFQKSTYQLMLDYILKHTVPSQGVPVTSQTVTTAPETTESSAVSGS